MLEILPEFSESTRRWHFEEPRTRKWWGVTQKIAISTKTVRPIFPHRFNYRFCAGFPSTSKFGSFGNHPSSKSKQSFPFRLMARFNHNNTPSLIDIALSRSCQQHYERSIGQVIRCFTHVIRYFGWKANNIGSVNKRFGSIDSHDDLPGTSLNLTCLYIGCSLARFTDYITLTMSRYIPNP